MSVSVTLNGATYTIPETSETGWGDQVTNWIQVASSALLQKTGGTFTLSAAADFGANYGLKSLYFSTREASPAGSGVVRLSNDEEISWRNAADSADLPLKVDSSNRLTFNGNPIVPSTALTASRVVVTDASGVLTTLNLGDGQLAIGNGGAPSAATLTGTTNQITVTNGAGSITLSTPQDINSGASPTFAGLTVSGLSDGLVKVASGVLSGAGTVDLASEVTGILPIANGGTGSATQNFVDLTTAQSVNGAKTFSELIGTTILAGSGTINASAVLEAASITKGFLPPRMTEAQRDAIGSPAAGLSVYNTDTNQLNIYNGTAWGAVGGGTAVDTFTGTTITTTNDPNQVWRYTGVSAQSLATLTFTDLPAGGRIIFTGTSNTNTLTIPTGLTNVQMNGERVLYQYSTIEFIKDDTQLIEVSRNGI